MHGEVYSLAVQPDGKVLVGGWVTNGQMIVPGTVGASWTPRASSRNVASSADRTKLVAVAYGRQIYT